MRFAQAEGYLQFANPQNPRQTIAGYSSALQGKSFQAWGNGGPYNTNPSQGGIMLQPVKGFGGDLITTVQGLLAALTPANIQTLINGEGAGMPAGSPTDNYVLQLPASSTVPMPSK